MAGAMLAATIVATHAAGGSPMRDALQSAVQQEMNVAVDVLKYQGATLTPVAIATSIPMPAGTPLAVTMSLSAVSSPNGSVRVTIDATAANSPDRAKLSADVGSRAPLAGTVLQAPGLAPMPTGAP
jgi:hypothetical protein